MDIIEKLWSATLTTQAVLWWQDAGEALAFMEGAQEELLGSWWERNVVVHAYGEIELIKVNGIYGVIVTPYYID